MLYHTAGVRACSTVTIIVTMISSGHCVFALDVDDQLTRDSVAPFVVRQHQRRPWQVRAVNLQNKLDFRPLCSELRLYRVDSYNNHEIVSLFKRDGLTGARPSVKRASVAWMEVGQGTCRLS